MRIVMALGGNALLRRNEPPEAEVQRQNIVNAVAKSVAPIARRHNVVVTHGNGPQIGLLALQASALREVAPYPLDILGAETEGMIGYLIGQALAEALPGREIATLLTQVEISPTDPAFSKPSKPIGTLYSETEARELASIQGWIFAKEIAGYRRVVASPAPQSIREVNTVRLLVNAGVIVICAGGGGIPVIVTPQGGLRGVEAVIDKDYAAALLAEQIDADVLLLLTDVPAVWSQWPASATSRQIRHTSPTALRAYQFESGSMAPKVEAACRFSERTGRIAAIGAMEDAQAILEGRAGTIVRV